MAYIPRTSKTVPTDMWQNTYWYDYPPNPFTGQWRLPNCTCYAWGRVCELGATNVTLSTSEAGDWYSYTSDGYERGQTPRLGAVGCWYSPSSSGHGHVAVVESISGTDVTFSNSAYIEAYDKQTNQTYYNNSGDYFYMTTLSYPYNFGADYSFQGFIYVPITGGGAPPEPSAWIYGNRYLTRAEQDNNAVKFYYTMSRLGASYNAILGMLANIEHESTINPGIWENLDAFNGGYGLVQWTPYTKYSQWAGQGWRDNGQKECERIWYEAENNEQWFDNPVALQYGYTVVPPVTLMQFMTSTENPKVLADYWLLYYEHPDESYISGRIAQHQAKVDYYNQLLGGGSPIPPVPPPVPPHGGHSSKFMYMISKRKFMRKRGLPWR